LSYAVNQILCTPCSHRSSRPSTSNSLLFDGTGGG
jgi:hypothetical protein